MCRIANNIDDIYLALCKDLLHAPVVGNTHELLNVKLQLKDINNNIISVRGISPSYLCGELLWYFTGSKSLEFISRFSSFWNHLSDDGETCNSAYGEIMQTRHGFNQIEKIIELLSKDPESRRAVININVPNEQVIETRDEPCTIAIQFLIRKGNLDCTVMMRSNDIWFGTPYDIAFFTELQKYVANRLGVGYGYYTHFATSLHLYDKDYDSICEIVNNPVSKKLHIDCMQLDMWKDTIAYALNSHIKEDQKALVVELFEKFNVLTEEINNEN